MSKRILVMVLTVCLAVAGMTVMAFADETYGDFTYTYDDTYKTATITGYSGTAIEAKIPSEIGNYTVIAIGEKAFYNNPSLASVIIPDTVTTIGDSAFSNCRSLISITIPNSVTTIGDLAFLSCVSLKSVVFEDGSQLTSIEPAVFWDCIALTSITIPSSVTSIGRASFQGCTSLTSITIPDNVATIDESAFAYCTALTDVYYAGDEDDWDEITISSSNDSLTDAFIHYGCSSAHDHTHSTSFAWSDDLSTCTVTIGCSDCSSTKTLDCEVSVTRLAVEYQYTATATIGWETYSTVRIMEVIYEPTVSVSEVTETSITITELTSYNQGLYGTALYSIDGTNWQISNVFNGLTRGTSYTVYAKYSGNSVCLESKVGSLTVSTLDHSLSHYAATTATCDTDGTIEYWHCSNCGKYFSDENAENEITLAETVSGTATGHSYTESWSWAANFSSATLTLTCSDCGDVQTVKATVTSEKDAGGNTVYTATISGTTFTDSKTVAAEKTTTSKSDPFTTLSRIQASYTGVQAAIAKANSLNPDDYENFSAVTEAIEAVDWSLNVLNQREVNSYAEAIEEAIENLVPAETVDIEEEIIEVIDPVEAGETDSE
ncbi:MAG: leucine-rich repeat domain-containing protein [Oscillospiraceae bacterium]|nr:leucine-rich repeat domain-containing protein [Oscillospiraceae bacterium]